MRAVCVCVCMCVHARPSYHKWAFEKDSCSQLVFSCFLNEAYTNTSPSLLTQCHSGTIQHQIKVQMKCFYLFSGFHFPIKLSALVAVDKIFKAQLFSVTVQGLKKKKNPTNQFKRSSNELDHVVQGHKLKCIIKYQICIYSGAVV